MQGRFAEAEPHLRVALSERPSSVEAEANLGVTLAARGQLEEGPRTCGARSRGGRISPTLTAILARSTRVNCVPPMPSRST